MLPDERLVLRQEKSRPILDQFHQWLTTNRDKAAFCNREKEFLVCLYAAGRGFFGRSFLFNFNRPVSWS